MTIRARRVTNLTSRAFGDDEKEAASIERGDYEIITNADGHRWLWFCCPGPCKTVTAIALRPTRPDVAQSWEFDGNDEAPTLTPSINHVGCWHGWLSEGVFSSC